MTVPRPALSTLLILAFSCLLVFPRANATDHDFASLPNVEKRYGSGEPYWFGEIRRQGKVAYGNNASYVLWRNVMDYGAKGDGVTDDTDAINNATFDGNRCTYPCDSQTTTPAIVYFPPGTYMISTPLIMTYYTQFIGDANNLPRIMGLPNFFGIALLDSDPYLAYGFSWYQNQNNFYRQVRNFVLDITLIPASQISHCLHWQVAQATSLQNIVFVMNEGGEDNAQIGVFMDNGSANFLEDLIFIGGNIGFFAGNQQFTIRNLTFNNCQTAIYQNWNWLFTYKEITINNAEIGVDMTQGGIVITTGSLILQDSVMNNVSTGCLTYFSANSTPISAGTLILDNVDFVDTPIAIGRPDGTVYLEGNQLVPSYVQGRAYSAYEDLEKVGNLSCYLPTTSSGRVAQAADAPPKPASLLDANGNTFSRSRPQYEGVPVTAFVSAKTYGCTGDGVTDDTACVQNFLDSITTDQIAFFDHGAYVIRETIQVPTHIKIVGEIWPLIMVDGSSPAFRDQDDPQPAFRVGNPGDIGAVEMSELCFETLGPAPGAIMMEWNLAGSYPGAAGMWDVHWRIGGSNGTQLQSDSCTKTPLVATAANASCIGSFLLVHITSTASLIMSNNWGWVSDHELDLPDHNQINIYNGRGILIESQGPFWMYGGSFEHSMLYNFQTANAKDIYMGAIQSETAYMQDNPNALTPFAPLTEWSDPQFTNCFSISCYKTFGARFYNSTYVLVYGLGLYSFFNNYDSGCLVTSNCQENIVSLEESEAIYLYALNTKASSNMVEVDSVELVPQENNVNGFCDTLAIFDIPGASLFVGGGVPGSGPYLLVDDYEPAVFFSKFNYYDSYDPTYGHVQYVSEEVAVRNGYVTTNENDVVISVDTTNKWPNGGPGRPSVRLISDNTYSHGLFVLDLSHMPWGCGTWPAFWLLGPNWPANGEIDIIEGVHTSTFNTISMHSSDNCTVSGTGQSGIFTSSNCYIAANDNSGCGSEANNTATPNNYGGGLNSIGGGVYITEWTSDYVQVWFFPRSAIPASISSGAPNIAQFGTPIAKFQGNCNIDAHFNNLSIIINTDFCGAWAGFTYSNYPVCPLNSSLPSTDGYDSCVDYVGNNPSAFLDAYWQINSVKVYQMAQGGSVSSSSSATVQSSAVPLSTSNTINLGMGQSASSITQSLSYSGPLSSISSTKTSSTATASATPFICPAYNNTDWTNYNGYKYQIACGSDFPGLNLGVVQVNSFEACLELCDVTSTCDGVAYLGGNGAGTCYPKNGDGGLHYDNHTFSALRLAGSADGSAYMGPSIPGPSSTASTFAGLSFSPSVTDPLATLRPTIQPSSCPLANGSTLQDENYVYYDVFCGADTAPNAVGSSTVTGGFTACFTICDVTPGCIGFTFVGYSDGICYFKNQYATPTFVGGDYYVHYDFGNIADGVSGQFSSVAIFDWRLYSFIRPGHTIFSSLVFEFLYLAVDVIISERI
ncbi:hypothetical protein MBLNU459_g7413t1 [Dothideomycetes sp. NU459]